MSGWTPEEVGTVVLVLGVFLVILLYELSSHEVDDAGPDGFQGGTGTAVKENHGTKVVVSQAYFWEPIETAPLGCKVQLKTIPGGIATYGEVTERNRKHFSDWAPLPTTRKERK